MIKVKLSLVLLVLLYFSPSSMGQLTLGAFGGLNNSQLSGDVAAKGSYNSLMGSNFGALLEFRLKEGLYLSFQPSFSQEGTKVSYKKNGEAEPVDSIKIRLNYFALPVLLKISSTNQRFYALTGIETGMLLNGSGIIEEDEEALSHVAQWNIAVHFGAGIRIPLGYPILFVEVRYTQGLLNITNEPLDTHIIPRVKTTGYKVFCGIEIPLKNQ